jgi:predicted alpha-1,2-mannosidase
MLSRLLPALVLLLAPVWSATAAQPDLSEHIDPFIGTGGHGHTFPGPTLPFGMVQLSPDTRLTGWDGCSGYHHSDTVVFGFSHTHLSGTGVGDYCDILLMPVAGEPHLRNGYPDQPNQGYGSRFSKDQERASAGYYRTFLDDYGVEVELTATPRTGLHRYVFPAGEPAYVIIDLDHRDELLDVGLETPDARTVRGFRRSRAWAQDQLVHFQAAFSRPFTVHQVMAGPGELGDRRSKAVLHFEDLSKSGGELLVQVAISPVDAAGAAANLRSEWADFDFAATHAASRQAWSEILTPFRLEGADEDELTIMATALYHSFIAPNLFSDVDGRYRGMDRQVHHAGGRKQYTVFSLWDTYRATHPLFTLVQQERTRDFADTAISHFLEGGRLPVWELAGNETDCMIGYHSVSFLADAWLKGILRPDTFDAELALRAMIDSAERDHFGLEAYKRQGYIAIEDEPESVSKTLEYSYDDACIARHAAALGKNEIAAHFGRRAQAWRHLLDPATRCFRPRTNGQWLKPYDPRQVDFHHTEANGWQYRFGAPHHMPRHLAALGGDQEGVAILDSLFTVANETTGRHQPDITGLMGQYAHGNEPSHHMAWLYHFCGQPWRSWERVNSILEQFYTARPDGLIGNEDCGQMSSWYVLSAYGLYDVAPTSRQWLVVPPLHERMSMSFENGKTFTTRREGEGSIETVTWNGVELEQSYLTHAQIMAGGELVFYMGENMKWGAPFRERPGTRPESETILAAPFADAPGDRFRGSMEVTLHCLAPDAEILWTADGADPRQGQIYSAPLTLTSTTEIRFVARHGGMISPETRAVFHAMPSDWQVTQLTDPNPQYTAGGPDALIDGRRGPDNWRTGSWQGYDGVDFVAVLDLGQPTPVGKLGASFLQDTRSWIFMPRRLQVEVSVDGNAYRTIGTVGHQVPDREEGIFKTEMMVDHDGGPVRFVRFTAENYGTLPRWHRGAGGQAFIFVDELLVE